jgi:WD40 repeat protein
VDNQQVGNLWQGDWLISTSLSGEFNYLDKNSGKVSRRVDGHSKAITALAVSSDDTLLTGSYDGRVYGWSYGDQGDHTEAIRLNGDGHANQVTSLATSSTTSTFFSAGMDDTLRKGKTGEKSFDVNTVSTGALPRSLAVSSDVVAVATAENVQIFNGDDFKKLDQHDDLGYKPSVVDVKDDQVFVGGEVSILVGQKHIGLIDKPFFVLFLF